MSSALCERILRARRRGGRPHGLVREAAERRPRELQLRTGAAVLLLALTFCVLPLTAAGAVPSEADPAIGDDPSFTSIAASVPTPPQPVTGSDRKQHLAYELLLTSLVPFPLST